ncbi:hypothetical protein KCP75_04865 [Salmonella enterica subsp. enterica]|nr:hypothetical protein KCP75_04865 [Salmonella enterica subsp. enterica]
MHPCHLRFCNSSRCGCARLIALLIGFVQLFICLHGIARGGAALFPAAYWRWHAHRRLTAEQQRRWK